MIPTDLTHVLSAHARRRVRAPDGPRWLQPILQDEDRWHCVLSTGDASVIRVIADDDLRRYRLAVQAPVPVQPFAFEPGKPAAEAASAGHNGIAAAALLLAFWRLPVTFSYAKRNQLPELRHVDLSWADGDKFGGADRARGGALRSFRLDRVDWIGLHADAVSRPVWAEGAYRRGLV